MKNVKVIIDGEEYVAVPRAEYLRLTGGEAPVEAVSFIQKALGKNLRAAREYGGFAVAALAGQLGVDTKTVRAAERGAIAVDSRYVRKVLRVCGLPRDWKAE